MARNLRLLFAVLLWSVATFALAAGCGKEDAEILDCSGECSCDEETNTCSCAGGSTCSIEGAGEDLTFQCDGNAACEMSCGDGCHVICPGTTGCTVTLGDGTSAECQGTAACTYDCEGDCDISCGGNTDCTTTCADGCEPAGDGCACE